MLSQIKYYFFLGTSYFKTVSTFPYCYGTQSSFHIRIFCHIIKRLSLKSYILFLWSRVPRCAVWDWSRHPGCRCPGNKRPLGSKSAKVPCPPALLRCLTGAPNHQLAPLSISPARTALLICGTEILLCTNVQKRV